MSRKATEAQAVPLGVVEREKVSTHPVVYTLVWTYAVLYLNLDLHGCRYKCLLYCTDDTPDSILGCPGYSLAQVVSH